MQEEKKTKEIGAESVNISYSALNDFEYKSKENNVPFYRDSVRSALAINAVEYKNRFSTAVTKFTGESGMYDMKFTSMKETDGESTYRILVNQNQVGQVQNPVTEVDYELNIYLVKNIRIENGQDIEVQFNSHSNDKIPEGDGFAFARGRWKEVAFRLVK